jgi:hypothetical protein
MAGVIQRWYRGCKQRSIHRNLKYKTDAYRRLLAVVRMQALIRRFQGAKEHTRVKLIACSAATRIGRHWRGYVLLLFYTYLILIYYTYLLHTTHTYYILHLL